MSSSRSLARAIAIGLVLIVPVSVVAEVLDRNVDDFDTSLWMWIPVLLLAAGYVVTGAIARGTPGAPLSYGAVAALGAFAGWLVVRIAVPLVQGDDLGFGVRNVVVNALLAAGFGLLGAVLRPGILSDGDEPAGWSRTGPRSGDPSEERPDSTGQGAG